MRDFIQSLNPAQKIQIVWPMFWSGILFLVLSGINFLNGNGLAALAWLLAAATFLAPKAIPQIQNKRLGEFPPLIKLIEMLFIFGTLSTFSLLIFFDQHPDLLY